MVVFLDVPPLARTIRAGLERRYRVEVAKDGGARYTYRLRTKVEKDIGAAEKPSDQKNRLLTSILDLKVRANGMESRIAKAGGGFLAVEPNGLPGGIEFIGAQGEILLPWIAFYLPVVKEGETFDVPSLGAGKGVTASGKGSLSGRDGIHLDLFLKREEKPFGTLVFDTKLDAEGWPTKAEGTLVSADGTYRATLERG